MGQGLSLALGEPYDSEAREWYDAHCGDGKPQDLTSPIICLTDSFRQLDETYQQAATSMDYYLKWTYAVVRNNIIVLCGAQNESPEEQERIFDKVWPAFYWMYNSADGKRMVDQLLTEIDLPQNAIDTIKLNHTDTVQRKYMVMNGAYSGAPMNFVRSTFYSGWTKPTWVTNGEISGEVKKTLREHNLLRTWTRPVTNPDLDPTGTFREWDATDAVGRSVIRLEDPGSWGNPFWTHEERIAARRRIMPVNAQGENFQDIWADLLIQTGAIDAECDYESCFEPDYTAGKQGAAFNDPIYGGKEPKLAFGANPFAFPGSNDEQTGGAGRTYRNPCDAKGPIELVLPWVAGIVGVGAVYFIFGRSNTSSHLLAITAGTSLYFAAGTAYGTEALFSIGEEKENGSSFAAAGIPASAVLFAHEYGLLEAANISLSVRNSYFASAAAAAAGYLLLKERLDAAFDVGGAVIAILTGPLSLVETGITLLFNGCVSQIFYTRFACTCNEANLTGGKDVMIEQFLGPIYGTTGQQKTLRKKCLQLEMRRGGWASTDPNDDNVVSRCMGIEMENPFACFTAQNWIYRAPAVPSLVRTDPQEIDMYNQISHCLDADNPSFLPPQDEFDVDCQQKYGEQFRQVRGAAAGTCKNYALPGPNNTDPVGLQDPGAYVEGSSTESCTIL